MSPHGAARRGGRRSLTARLNTGFAFVTVVFLALVIPPAGLVLALSRVAAAVRGRAWPQARRYGTLTIVAGLTTAALVFGVAGPRSLAASLYGIAVAVLFGLFGALIYGRSRRPPRARRGS